MFQKNNLNFLPKIFVLIIIIIFFIFNLNRINFGLPFFYDADEVAFLKSTLSFLSPITNIEPDPVDPVYAPLLNLVISLKYIFFNELILNSLSIDQIKLKIYFNPHLFVFYGRIASLTVTSLSIFLLYLVFRKLKINFLIYSLLLISFSISLVSLSVSLVNGKNSFYLFIYLLQLYFLIKYFLKIEKFKLNSYIIFGLLGSIAWGVNYWSSIISIYAIIILHFKKFKFTKFSYVILFLIVFIFFGPVINMILLPENLLNYFIQSGDINDFNLKNFNQNFLKDITKSFQILYFTEKNILLLSILTPIFFIKKLKMHKGIFLIISFLFFEPIFLFAIFEDVTAQLRYFSGIVCAILILVSILVNEINKTNKYLIYCFFLVNLFFIYNQIKVNSEINYIVSQKHSFYNFQKEIESQGLKTIYISDISLRKNIKNNELYLNLHKKNIIKNHIFFKDDVKEINKKIDFIKESDNSIYIGSEYNLKNDLIIFNPQLFEIKSYKKFFKHINSQYDYIVVDLNLNNDINRNLISYIEKNFLLIKNQFHLNENKIFFKNFRELLQFYSFGKNFDKEINNLVYGKNYSLYKVNN
tara:strand:- start:386 stop:2137 length:1752 start_codon:yes stop_codon:yes gene_type:complete